MPPDLVLSAAVCQLFFLGFFSGFLLCSVAPCATLLVCLPPLPPFVRSPRSPPASAAMPLVAFSPITSPRKRWPRAVRPTSSPPSPTLLCSPTLPPFLASTLGSFPSGGAAAPSSVPSPFPPPLKAGPVPETRVVIAPSRFALVLAAVVAVSFAAVAFVVLCVGVAALQGKLAPGARVPASPVASAVSPAPCLEDQPCWSCATMGNRVCGPVVAPVDPWPSCGPACHAPAAAAAVDAAAGSAGPGFVCWAEDNPLLPPGFEVLCRRK